MAFCKEYNAQTAKMAGDVVPVEITVYEVRWGSRGAGINRKCRNRVQVKGSGHLI